MTDFDKNICIQNIYHLVKKHDVRLGDLEQYAKVSSGYFSRLKQSKSNPPIETLYRLAQRFELSLDTLVGVNLTALTPTEEYLITFIDKLLHNLVNHSDIWEKEHYQDIMRCRDNDQFPIPLLSYYSASDDEEEMVHYDSLFIRNTEVHIAHDVYVLNLNCDDKFFLTHTYIDLDDGTSQCGYELYLQQRWKVSPVCCGYASVSPVLFSPLSKLYNALYDTFSHAVLSNNVRDAVDLYMNAEDLPF